MGGGGGWGIDLIKLFIIYIQAPHNEASDQGLYCLLILQLRHFHRQ